MLQFIKKHIVVIFFFTGLIFIVFLGRFLWILLPDKTNPTATASITSTDTPTPGTDTTVTASVTSEAETGTPVTGTDTSVTPSVTSNNSGIANSVTPLSPVFTGICLEDVVKIEGFLSEDDKISAIFNKFPKFNDWCSSNIKYFVKLNEPESMIKIEQNELQEVDVKSIFLMASVNGDISSRNNGSIAVVEITYIYKGRESEHVNLIPGRHVAYWNYHIKSSNLTRAMPEYTYRVWSGLDAKKETAAQVLITVLDPSSPNGERIDLETHPLIGIEIESVDYSDLYLDLYGLMISNLTPEQVKSMVPQSDYFEPICINPPPGEKKLAEISIVGSEQTRSQPYTRLIRRNDDYYRDILGTCNPIIVPSNLPDELVRPTTDSGVLSRIPFTVFPTIYETRPPDNAFEISGEPGLTLTITPTRKIRKVHLLLSARNVCNIDNDDSLVVGEIKLEDGNPIPVVLDNNMYQGRSGITECLINNHDLRFLDDPNLFLRSIPLAAKEMPDTNNEPVALWANVVSIPVPDGGIPANTPFEVIITDLTEPERNESADPDSRDTVEYSDTYLVLYGVTLEYAE